MSHPIWEVLEFQGRSLKWLAERTRYGYGHVQSLSKGRHPVTAEFRKRAALALDLPEHILFNDDGDEQATAPATHAVEGSQR